MNNLSSIVQQLDALPATITKDQFYRICHISKRHAKYLLDSGLVKCVDSGKKTRKYKIEMKDVLAYLIDRELDPEKYRAPAGYYIGNSGKLKRCIRRSQAPGSVVTFHFTEQEKPGLLAAWEAAAADYKDLMTTAEVCELTGYGAQTVHRWHSNKSIAGFVIQSKLLISKLTLVEFQANHPPSRVTNISITHIHTQR